MIQMFLFKKAIILVSFIKLFLIWYKVRSKRKQKNIVKEFLTIFLPHVKVNKWNLFVKKAQIKKRLTKFHPLVNIFIPQNRLGLLKPWSHQIFKNYGKVTLITSKSDYNKWKLIATEDVLRSCSSFLILILQSIQYSNYLLNFNRIFNKETAKFNEKNYFN